jgi:hypothetical protein
VTGSGGTFTIKGFAPGDYTLEAWGLGPSEQVTIRIVSRLRRRLFSSPRSNHLPSFLEPSIYLILGDRSYVASDVVGRARFQNRLMSFVHLRRILGHAEVSVQITSLTDEER